MVRRSNDVVMGLAVVAGVVGLAGCTEDDSGFDLNTFQTRETIEQLYVLDAVPGAAMELYSPEGELLQDGTVDENGSLIFRGLAAADGYRIRWPEGGEETDPLTVSTLEGSVPDTGFYNQEIGPGFSYVTTRDGTTLSVYVVLPGPPEDGPYPTLVNYSGYDPSKPGEPFAVPGGGISVEPFCGEFPVLCDAPPHPSALVGGILKYATVGVNMRGTGCSGGAYDFFDQVQLADGYDVIEVIAQQDWVKHNHVGMAGLSYPGLSQIFVASTQPPSLAAITPLSVIGSTQDTLVPGGIRNDGFAVEWGDRVLSRADPYGQGWEQSQVDAGDTVCEQNQRMHSQKADILQKIEDNPYYDPPVADPINLDLLAPKINVPVFLASAFQDEQTGPGFASLLDKFDQAPVVRQTVYNGLHPDGYGPMILPEWHNFLSIYVAEEVPQIPETIKVFAPLLFEAILGAAVGLPDERFADYPDVAMVRAEYEAEQQVRAMFDVGGNPEDVAGAPVPGFEYAFDQWPAEGTTPMRMYFQPDGQLGDAAPTASGSASAFEFDPAEGQQEIIADGSDVWDLVPDYNWRYHAEGRTVAFESEAFAEDHLFLGHGSADLWIRSSADDADLEVTITEVRPDGQEMLVQSGWLRASLRALAADATELRPTHSYLESEVEMLNPDEWTEVRVEIMPFSHPFRAGSKLRVYVDTPGNSRTRWRFATKAYPAGTTFTVGHDADHPSSIALAEVSRDIPTTLPDCPGNRGMPCRETRPVVNSPG